MGEVRWIKNFLQMFTSCVSQVSNIFIGVEYCGILSTQAIATFQIQTLQRQQHLHVTMTPNKYSDRRQFGCFL